MKLKEIIGAGIVYAGIFASYDLSLGNRYVVDGYIVRQRGGQTSVTARHSNNTFYGTLVDENNDGTPDRKYAVIASRQGIIHHDIPIIDKDRQIFSDITSKL